MTSPTESADTVRQTAASDLAACRVEDFDGHTAFATLSPEQRLDWADRAARLFIELHGRATADVRGLRDGQD